MSKVRLKPQTRQAVFEGGWNILTIHQPPWLFPRDGRKLSLCPIPSDPWHATLFNGASILSATRNVSGQGATADEAVLAALPAGTSLRDAVGRLETAVEGLIGAIRDA